MPVQINEIIIRAIITNDDAKAKAGAKSAPKKNAGADELNKLEVVELINEVLKNKNER